MTVLFDYVFVCNGHYSKPFIPEFPGREIFNGNQMHSHDYRRPETFVSEDVLVIGFGPSAKDIAYHIATKANRVCISTHRDTSKNVFRENVTVKQDVREINATGVVFGDGSEDTFTTILYCTGNC